jgi:hypothetical protein
MKDSSQEALWLRWRGVADLYQACFTGLILSLVTRRGATDAAEFVFRAFRRQQQERFLPGLKKLGIDYLPPAVAAAQYHYLSNRIGGVHVEYMRESDRKAWIRYPPPRWIWKGTAICGIPSEVSKAMLRGWHANIGVALGDVRLGLFAPSRASTARTGWRATTTSTTIRLSSSSALSSRVTRRRRCSIPRARRRCRLRAGRAQGLKRPIATTRWTMCGPLRP